MKARELLDVLTVAEKLKGEARHCQTSNGKFESVAAHSWMCALMAYFMKDEFLDADMDKVIRMCLIHDLSEAFTGDIPVFEKSKMDEIIEEEQLNHWVNSLPEAYSMELKSLFLEMKEQKSLESKIYKSIDKMEAVFQHNCSDISTWLNLEYDLNRTYAYDQVSFNDYLLEVREEIKKDTIEKIEKSQSNL